MDSDLHQKPKGKYMNPARARSRLEKLKKIYDPIQESMKKNRDEAAALHVLNDKESASLSSVSEDDAAIRESLQNEIVERSSRILILDTAFHDTMTQNAELIRRFHVAEVTLRRKILEYPAKLRKHLNRGLKTETRGPKDMFNAKEERRVLLAAEAEKTPQQQLAAALSGT